MNRAKRLLLSLLVSHLVLHNFALRSDGKEFTAQRTQCGNASLSAYSDFSARWVRQNIKAELQTLGEFPTLTAAEQAEEQAARGNDPVALFKARIATTRAYLYANKVDQAEEKWKVALTAIQKLVVNDVDVPKWKLPRRGPPILFSQNPLQRSTIASILINLCASFENAESLANSEEVNLAAYRLALGSDRIGASARLNAELLAKKYRSSGDTVGGARVLCEFLQLAKEYRGPNSIQVRLWKLKLANYYATSGERESTKRLCADFLKSLDGSGTAADSTTIDYMIEHAFILRTSGFSTQAARVEKKLAKIRTVHAAAR